MLTIDNVNVHYGAVRALEDVSLEVQDREIVAVIGSNGSGKSTLLAAISGIVPVSSGSCSFKERELDSLAPHEIVGLGISHIPQGGELFPNMTVLENLELGAEAAKKTKLKKEKLAAVFDEFSILYERRNQKAGTLSGGQQQLVAIGRALMSDPSMLLLDEPSAGLAPIAIEKLTEVLRTLEARGIPMLLVEQNALLALQLSERAYVMESGRIVTSEKSSVLRESDVVKRAYLGVDV